MIKCAELKKIVRKEWKGSYQLKTFILYAKIRGEEAGKGERGLV